MIFLFSLSVRLIMSCKLVLVIFVYVLLQLPQGMQIPMVVVEGLNRNTYIPCGLDPQTGPLYWNITGSVYDLYSVPMLFQTERYTGLLIPLVNRNMNNWTLQCFTTLPGPEIFLTVVYSGAADRRVNFAPVLEPSVQGRLLLDYQNLEVGAENTTLRWQYYPDPNAPCVGTRYRVEVYSDQDIISAESEETLQPVSQHESPEDMVYYIMHDQDYFIISALNMHNQSCARMEYFTGMNVMNVTYNTVLANEDFASFVIPDYLQDNNSIQLIWSKDNNTQCVCPPVEEIISECACNRNNTSNLVTIFGSRLTISNLADNIIRMYFVFLESSRCCNIRSVTGIYEIIFRGPPQAPGLTYNRATQMFCFSSLSNPQYPARYEVNVTDVTGALSLRGSYETSQCLNLSDLFPDVCGPFNVSVTARNDFGESNNWQHFRTNTEKNDCSCNVAKDQAIISVISVASTTATIELICPSGYAEDNVTLIIQDQTSNLIIHSMGILCNGTRTIDSLRPKTNYTINRIYTEMKSCFLKSFSTNQGSIVVVQVVVGVIIFVLYTIVIIYISWKCGKARPMLPVQVHV